MAFPRLPLPALTGSRGGLRLGCLALLALCGCASAPGAAPSEASATPIIELAGTSAPPSVLDPNASEPSAAEIDGDPAADAVRERLCLDAVAQGEQSAPRGPDRQLYRQALKLQQQGEEHEAHQRYLALIDQHKQSTWVPLAYFQLAEMLRDGAEDDPIRFEPALRLYRETIKQLAPGHAAYPVVLYRLGQCEQAAGDHAEALSVLVRVIEQYAATPDPPCSEVLAQQSRRALIRSYLAIGSPAKAYRFFQRISGDPALDGTRTAAMMLQLADGYLQENRSEQALTVLVTLVKHRPQPELCHNALAQSARLSPTSKAALRLQQQLEQQCAGR